MFILKHLLQCIKKILNYPIGQKVHFKGLYPMKFKGTDCKDDISEESKHIAYLIQEGLYFEGEMPFFEAFLANPYIDGLFLFLCDGKGCPAKCFGTDPHCKHTVDINHALNYEKKNGHIVRKGT